MKIKKIFKISIIKTLRINLHYFGFKGLKLPIIVSKNIKLEKLKGKVLIENKKRIFLGFGPTQAKSYESGFFYNNGEIHFYGEAHFYDGVKIYNNGLLEFGDIFKVGASKIYCEKHIKFGNDVLISWNDLIMDSDLHDIISISGEKVNHNRDVNIGNHVWIGANCTILKNTSIPNNCIIAANSLLSSKELLYENVIYSNGGAVLKKDVNWKWEMTSEK